MSIDFNFNNTTIPVLQQVLNASGKHALPSGVLVPVVIDGGIVDDGPPSPNTNPLPYSNEKPGAGQVATAFNVDQSVIERYDPWIDGAIPSPYIRPRPYSLNTEFGLRPAFRVYVGDRLVYPEENVLDLEYVYLCRVDTAWEQAYTPKSNPIYNTNYSSGVYSEFYKIRTSQPIYVKETGAVDLASMGTLDMSMLSILTNSELYELAQLHVSGDVSSEEIEYTKTMFFGFPFIARSSWMKREVNDVLHNSSHEVSMFPSEYDTIIIEYEDRNSYKHAIVYSPASYCRRLIRYTSGPYTDGFLPDAPKSSGAMTKGLSDERFSSMIRDGYSIQPLLTIGNKNGSSNTASRDVFQTGLLGSPENFCVVDGQTSGYITFADRNVDPSKGTIYDNRVPRINENTRVTISQDYLGNYWLVRREVKLYQLFKMTVHIIIHIKNGKILLGAFKSLSINLGSRLLCILEDFYYGRYFSRANNNCYRLSWRERSRCNR